MTVRSLIAAAGLIAATFATASPAGATPVTALARGGETQNLIVKVHGCHRSCEWGPVLRWHRHGRACRPIRCWPRAVHPHRCWIDWRGVRHCRW